MSTCPNCGHENNEGDRFCANCGTRVTPVAPPRSETQPDPFAPAEAEPSRETNDSQDHNPEPSRGSIPPPVTPSFAQQNSRERQEQELDDDWRMSDLGPPPKRRRPLWLWILIGISVLILVCCIGGFLALTYTETGQQLWDDVVATATAQAVED